MRTLGLIFVFLGLLILFQQFHPAFIEPLYQYAPYIKRAFWGESLALLCRDAINHRLAFKQESANI